MTMNATPMISANAPRAISRLLNIEDLLSRKSHFLFGPRQTGKTFLARRMLKNARFYDLLDSSVYLLLSQNPGRIAEETSPEDRIVVIDEIQRIPKLDLLEFPIPMRRVRDRPVIQLPHVRNELPPFLRMLDLYETMVFSDTTGISGDISTFAKSMSYSSVFA